MYTVNRLNNRIFYEFQVGAKVHHWSGRVHPSKPQLLSVTQEAAWFKYRPMLASRQLYAFCVRGFVFLANWIASVTAKKMLSKKFRWGNLSVRLFCGLNRGQHIRKTWGGSEEAANKNMSIKKKQKRETYSCWKSR